MMKWLAFVAIIVILTASTTTTAQSSYSSTAQSSYSSTAQSSYSTTAMSSGASTIQTSGGSTTQSPSAGSTQASGTSKSSVTGPPTTAGAIISSSLANTDAPSSSIRILLNSDLKYNIFPVYNDNHSLCTDFTTGEQQTSTDCVGGLSRLVSYVDSNIHQFDLFVDAGNIAGQTYFPQLKFNPLADVIERLNFTAMAVDAELLMYGADAAHQGFLSGDRNAAVAANLNLSSVEVEKSRIITWDKKCDVAVIGVVSRSKVEELSVPGVNATDEVSAVEQELQYLTNQKSSEGKLITIVIGDIDEITTEAIAKIADVNLVIVSGASISDTGNISTLANVTHDGNAYVVSLQQSDKFPFVLGSLELTIGESSCNVTDVKLEPQDYSQDEQTNDTAVRELEKAGVTRLQQMTSRALAASTAVVPSAGCDATECALGNLVTDAIVSQLMVEEQDAPRLAVYPGRSFSNASLSTEITGNAVDALFERDDFLYSVTLAAPELKSMLEQCVGNGDDSSFLQISALMNVQFDLSKPAGSRVESVRMVTGDAVTFSSVDLTDSAANYSIAVVASMLWNSSVLQGATRQFHLLSVSEAVKAHMLRAGVLVIPPAGGRVTYVAHIPVAPTTPTPVPKPCPTVVTCPDNTATTIFITLLVTAACVGGASLFWVYAMPRIRMYRARRDSSLPLVVHY